MLSTKTLWRYCCNFSLSSSSSSLICLASSSRERNFFFFFLFGGYDLAELFSEINKPIMEEGHAPQLLEVAVEIREHLVLIANAQVVEHLLAAQVGM